MPRPNYMVAWNNLKDIVGTLHSVHGDTLSAETLLRLMLELEHHPLDWSNLYEVLQHLKAPQDH